jgi:hypothetical protein
MVTHCKGWGFDSPCVSNHTTQHNMAHFLEHFKSFLARIDRDFDPGNFMDEKRDITSNCIPGSFYLRGIGHLPCRVTKRVDVSHMRTDAGNPYYTIMAVIIDGTLVQSWGCTSPEDEKMCHAWFAEHKSRLYDKMYDTESEYKQAFKNG